QSAIGVASGSEIGNVRRRPTVPIPKKDGAPVPGSPGLQAISFNTSCEIEIAPWLMQGAGQLAEEGSEANRGAPRGIWRPQRPQFRARPGRFMLNVCAAGGRWLNSRQGTRGWSSEMAHGRPAAIRAVRFPEGPSLLAAAWAQNGVRLRMA